MIYQGSKERISKNLLPFIQTCIDAKETYPTGEEAWHVYHWDNGNCFMANTIKGDYDTEEEAIEAWNRRAE